MTATFDRSLDWRWRRTSYSDITSGTYDARVGSEPEEPIVTDEPAGEVPVAADPDAQRDPGLNVPSPLSGLPVGLRIGPLVHRVLEETDLAAAHLGRQLIRAS